MLGAACARRVQRNTLLQSGQKEADLGEKFGSEHLAAYPEQGGGSQLPEHMARLPASVVEQSSCGDQAWEQPPHTAAAQCVCRCDYCSN